MRAITNITIRKDIENTRKPYDVFLEYNGKAHDYSFTPFKTFQQALQSIPRNDSYFPLHTDVYTLLIIERNKTHFREEIKL